MDFKWFSLFILALGAMMIPTLMANNDEFNDAVWQRRAQEARNASLSAYDPNPHRVVRALNEHIKQTLEEIKPMINNTRRELRGQKYRGQCKVTNPIDRCWRCNRNWHLNRKRLADCAIGFGRKTTGGKAGRFYVVTDSSDNDLVNPKAGTLRHAVIQKEPLWIIFAQSMVIKLNGELLMTGDKTIDGRGANVHIAHGAGITIQSVSNVIIHSLHIHDIVQGDPRPKEIRDSVDHYGVRTMSDGDGISIFTSFNVWIDHISMWRCKDGLIDVIEESTAITISNCHFTDHDEVMLLGASNKNFKDRIMQVTIAFNHFGKRLVQRMPRCRWGFVHIVNNDYTHWEKYAIGGSSNPTIISQGNRYIASPNLPDIAQVTYRVNTTNAVWQKWTWRSEGDLMLKGAYFVQSGNPNGARPFDNLVAHAGHYAPFMTRFAGCLNCTPGKPC